MDRFISIDEALTKLQAFTRYDLFYAAIDGRINMYWCPTGSGYGIDVVKVELVKTTGLDDVECERWRSVKGSKVSEHEFGPYLIDISIDELWPIMLSTIKDGDSILGSAPIDCFSEPIKFKDLNGCVYATHFYDPFAPVLPRTNELCIRTSELKDIKKILKGIRDGSTTVGKITYIRQKFIKEYLDKNNLWHRINEVQQKRGKSTFKAELWKKEDFSGKKDKNGKFIFANLDGSELNKQNFYDALHEVINNRNKITP